MKVKDTDQFIVIVLIDPETEAVALRKGVLDEYPGSCSVKTEERRLRFHCMFSLNTISSPFPQPSSYYTFKLRSRYP